jgi:hypothetical protein
VSFLEPFCGHLSPKIDKVSLKLTFEYPHEGPCVVGGRPAARTRGKNCRYVFTYIHINYTTCKLYICKGGLDVIRKESWPFYKTSSGVRLCWELEKPKGPTCVHIVHTYMQLYTSVYVYIHTERKCPN